MIMAEKLKITVRDILNSIGFDEVQTPIFTNGRILDDSGIDEDSWERDFVRLENSHGEEAVALRTVLTPGMLELLGRNCIGGLKTIKAYEIGSTFMPSITKTENNGFPEESCNLSIGIYDGSESFSSLKGIIEKLLNDLEIGNIIYETEAEYGVYNPEKCVRILLDISCMNNRNETITELEKKINDVSSDLRDEELKIMRELVEALSGVAAEDRIEIGIMGEIHPDVAERFGIENGACCCEMHFEILDEFRRKS